MNKFFNILILIGIFSLSIFILGCSKARESAGVTRKVPDEYSVISNKPLAIPPDYNVLPKEEIITRKQSFNDGENDLSKEILFGLNEDIDTDKTKIFSTAESILKKSGANEVSDDIREEIDSQYAKTSSYVGTEKYVEEEEILNSSLEAERIRNNLFDNKNILYGESPITVRPKNKEDNFLQKLF